MHKNMPVGSNTILLEPREFRMLGEFIERDYGIKMPDSKRVMLQSRLQKRLRDLDLRSFSEYCRYAFKSENSEHELTTLVDLATTNKTDFFREPHHFEFMREQALPQMREIYGSGHLRPFRLWSAGCSTGEEPYTLAIIMAEQQEKTEGFKYDIHATDLSTEALYTAQNAIYEEEKVEPIALNLKKKYLLKSRVGSDKLIRIVQALRNMVSFRQVNLMDSDYGLKHKMDVIFCRNVIIYFDRKTQEGLIQRLIDNLLPGGYLFLGHSETINWLNVRLDTVAHTVYRKPLK